ncbi:hypothetical protein JW916_08480 [Candidatus Sumerlaeota bacterium]|nr:hypothetical protein [Candidatus Sumerlaeota bacterium]
MTAERPIPPPSEIPPPTRRFQSAILAALAAVVTFFVARTALEIAVDTTAILKTFGFHSPTEDFDALPFFVLSALSLGFNTCICCALGIMSHRLVLRFRRPTRQFASAAIRFAAYPMTVLTGWLALFNLPRLFPSHDPERILSLEWPPEYFYPPVRLLLLAFYPLGNLGAVTGFAVGLLIAEVRLRAREREGRPIR